MAIIYEGKKIFPSAWEAGLREDEDQAQPATAAVGCCQKMESDMRNTASTMIHHDAVAYSYWKTFTLVLVALTLITLPIQLAGILSSSIQERLSELSYGLDVGFFIDLLINFRLTYVDPMTGMVKDDPRVVRNRYFFSYFWPDFLSIIPFEIFSGGGISMPAEIAELLGLLRFLRIRRLIELFKTLEKDENWSYTLVISFKFLFMLVILAHFAGCFMWWLSKLEPDPMDTWLSNTSDLIDSNDPFTKYIVGMYFAFTTITTVRHPPRLRETTIQNVTLFCAGWLRRFAAGGTHRTGVHARVHADESGLNGMDCRKCGVACNQKRHDHGDISRTTFGAAQIQQAQQPGPNRAAASCRYAAVYRTRTRPSKCW